MRTTRVSAKGSPTGILPLFDYLTFCFLKVDLVGCLTQKTKEYYFKNIEFY